jgi:hypothetical protein
MPELAICLGSFDDQKVDQALRGLGSDPRFSAWFAGRPDREEHPQQVECSLATLERMWGQPRSLERNFGMLSAKSETTPTDPVWSMFFRRCERSDWISIEPPDWDLDEDWRGPGHHVAVGEWLYDIAATLLGRCRFEFAMIVPHPPVHENREYQAFAERGVPDKRWSDYLVPSGAELQLYARNTPWVAPSLWTRTKEKLRATGNLQPVAAPAGWQARVCRTCKRTLVLSNEAPPGDPAADCGGDCLACMALIGEDPDCIRGLARWIEQHAGKPADELDIAELNDLLSPVQYGKPDLKQFRRALAGGSHE